VRERQEVQEVPRPAELTARQEIHFAILTWRTRPRVRHAESNEAK